MFVDEMGLALLCRCKRPTAVGLEALGRGAPLGTVLSTLAILAWCLRSSPRVVRWCTLVLAWRLLVQDVAVGAGVVSDLLQVVSCCGYLGISA